MGFVVVRARFRAQRLGTEVLLLETPATIASFQLNLGDKGLAVQEWSEWICSTDPLHRMSVKYRLRLKSDRPTLDN